MNNPPSLVPPKYWVPPIYNSNGRQQQWIFCCETAHNCWCGCPDFLTHLMDVFFPLNDPKRSKTIHELVTATQPQRPVATGFPALPCPIGDTENGGPSGAAAAASENIGPEPEERDDLADINEEDLRRLFEEAEQDDTG